MYGRVYQSGFFYNNRTHTNVAQQMSLTALCNSNENTNIKFSICTANSEVNSVITTVAELRNGKKILEGQRGSRFEMVTFDVVEKPTFVDYLRSGWAVSLVAAIDYTASNGNPSSPSSLHYLGGNNQYE